MSDISTEIKVPVILYFPQCVVERREIQVSEEELKSLDCMTNDERADWIFDRLENYQKMSTTPKEISGFLECFQGIIRNSDSEGL